MGATGGGSAVLQMADVCPFVQLLDAPVPQTGMGNLLLEVFRLLDSQVLKQAVDVPKISQDMVDRDLRRAQMAEQLVEVPTVLSLSLLQQQRAEQIVGRVSGGIGQWRSQGFLPEQDSTASEVEQIIDIPDRVSQRHPHFLAVRMRRLKVFFFFALLPELKKVRGLASSAEITRQVEFPRWVLIKWLVPESPRTRAHRRWRLMCRKSGSTSTAARGWLRLVCLGGGGCSATASLRTSSGMSPVRRWRRRRGGRGGSGRVFKVFSQDKVLQRFVQQIFDDFLAGQGSTAPFVEQNHVA